MWKLVCSRVPMRSIVECRLETPGASVHTRLPHQMTIRAGSCLSHSEIVAPLGAGGMGDVCRARKESNAT